MDSRLFSGFLCLFRTIKRIVQGRQGRKTRTCPSRRYRYRAWPGVCAHVTSAVSRLLGSQGGTLTDGHLRKNSEKDQRADSGRRRARTHTNVQEWERTTRRVPPRAACFFLTTQGTEPRLL